MRTLITSITLLLISATALFAQCPPRGYQTLNTNQVYAGFTNGGDMHWDLTGSPFYAVPAAGDTAGAIHSMFATALWMGGLDGSGQLHVAAQTYRQSGYDYFPGPVRAGHAYECDERITLPESAIHESMFIHSTGMLFLLEPGGYSFVDLTSGAVSSFILPGGKTLASAIELATGEILVYGDPLAVTPSELVIIDPLTMTASLTGDSLLFGHYQNYSPSVLLSSGEVVIVGKLGVEKYDPSTGLSVALSPMGAPRHSTTLTLLPGGNILSSGGSTAGISGSGGSTVTEVLDPIAGTWSSGPSMSETRNGHKLLELASGDFLILGGDRNDSKTIDRYNPVSNTISTFASLKRSYGRTDATILPSGEALIMGESGGTSLGFYEVLDTTTGSTETYYPMEVGPQIMESPSGDIWVNYGGQVTLYDPSEHAFGDARWDKIWKVSKSQINEFISDHAAGIIDFTKYPDIQDWPAHGDTTKGEDWLLAPFVDVNGNGFYRPVADGDYPCIPGDEALWWVFNDIQAPHTESTGEPLGVQVAVTAYSFNCSSTDCPDSAIDFSTFYHYEIINKSTETYYDYHVGAFTDADLGFYADDFIGSDSLLDLAFMYNGDNDDAGATGYGLNPPAIGTTVLRSPDNLGMTSAGYYENDFSIQGNPEMPSHYYGYLQSIWKDGSHVVDDGDDGYDATGVYPETNYMFYGDPGFCGGSPTGWNEVNATHMPFDRRYVVGTGPIEFAPGDKLKMDYAVIWARGTDYLNSVCELKSATSNIRTWWSNLSNECFDLVISVDPPSRPTPAEFAVNFYPNPSSGSFNVFLEEIPKFPVEIVMIDAMGRVIGSERIEPGNQHGEIGEEGLSAGIYTIKVSNPQLGSTSRLVIVK